MKASLPCLWRVVMEILGYSQISLTMNTYSHVIPALQREAAARLDSVLDPGKASDRPPQDDRAETDDGSGWR